MFVFKNCVPYVNDAPPSSVSFLAILFKEKILLVSILLSSILIFFELLGLYLREILGLIILVYLFVVFLRGYVELYSINVARSWLGFCS